MHPYPHRYAALAHGAPAGAVALTSADLPAIASAPPPQFGGPEGMWSPETLVCAALADCFVLTFRAIARVARFDWSDLSCRVEGTLDRGEGVAHFTGYKTFATLSVSPGADRAKARHLLEKAEAGCLISNSLRGSRELVVEICEPASAAARSSSMAL